MLERRSLIGHNVAAVEEFARVRLECVSVRDAEHGQTAIEQVNRHGG
ncbi:hypothetical protein EV386_3030 [Xylanimonas ulmi]|uniref:Uncharacterized protein n=1 Tax=Xylanimonas ulmi TaxID=228973 RepID=A0A4Q7M6H5_9MICO|nr:hypothetical protein EV386_3030 [Xylanibacterium ulmi]